MYVIACVLGAGLQVVLLTQAPAILALMGAGPSTVLFKEASGYLKVCMLFLVLHTFVFLSVVSGDGGRGLVCVNTHTPGGKTFPSINRTYDFWRLAYYLQV